MPGGAELIVKPKDGLTFSWEMQEWQCQADPRSRCHATHFRAFAVFKTAMLRKIRTSLKEPGKKKQQQNGLEGAQWDSTCFGRVVRIGFALWNFGRRSSVKK